MASWQESLSHNFVLRVIALAWLTPVAWVSAADQFSYPVTRRIEQTDTFHGVSVLDPYRWLETDVRQSEEITAWITAQNQITAKYLDAKSEREAIGRRLKALWNYERYSPPIKAGARYAFLRNNGLQNHAVLLLIDKLDGEPRVLLDPNQWSKDGSVALAGTSFSNDGRYLAYGVSEAGSDWQTWKLIEVASGKLLSDELKWLKFTHIAWTKDNAGFYYVRYDEPKEGAKYQGLNLNQQIRYHRVGTAQSSDALVYSRPDHPDWCFDVQVTDDGEYLVVNVRKADDEHYRILYQVLSQASAEMVELIDHFDNQFFFVGNSGPQLFFVTDRDAPQRKLIEIDTRKPRQSDWKVIIPETKETLKHVTLVGERFLALSFKDASTRARVYMLDGKLVRDIELPGIGTAIGFQGRAEETETFFSFSSFITPAVVYRYDIVSGETTLFRKPKLNFNPDDYQVEQVFVPSKDGTRVPMFLSHKKRLRRDGSNPTLLYGYGGFGISLTPSFSVSALTWMEMGGVYAMPNLRGGDEYGEAWHAAGTKTNKQNVFDDFIAAAEWLIKNQYTKSEKLAVHGASNGGLLVAAVLIQRPKLFGACVADVPVTDMLRFQHFTDGRFWVTDYGSVEDPSEFRALRAYSPYHNVKDNTEYPPTLVTTADTDDRVVPAHSFKFVAALQRAQTGTAPVLLRVGVRSGHGSGKPTAQRIEEITDQFVFLTKTLHMNVGSAADKESSP